MHRKKLLDSYQHFSVSSYCTAFSYKPIFEDELILKTNLERNYVLECPSNVCDKLSNLEPLFNKIENLSDTESLNLSHDGTLEKSNKIFGFDSDSDSIKSQAFEDDIHTSRIKQNILSLNSDQIFLGMVSMQYKARIVCLKLFFLHNNKCFLIR